MKSKLTTALTLLLALVFVVSSFAGCANGGEGTESGSASGSDATDSGSETSEIANAKEELGKVDWGGKEFGILLYDGFSGEVKAEDGVVDKEGGNSQVINDAVYTRNNLLESECGLKFNWVLKPADQATKAISTEATVPTVCAKPHRRRPPAICMTSSTWESTLTSPGGTPERQTSPSTRRCTLCAATSTLWMTTSPTC